jgi:methionine sulfoxide reductase catalytic subunit
MLIKNHRDGFIHPASSDITPRAAYENRRELLKLIAAGAAGSVLASWASREALGQV